MAYPQAPWALKGYAFLTLHLIDLAKASSFIPAELAIVPSIYGKTLGGIYLSQYTHGSDLIYSELIVVAGLIRRNGVVGSWISHIYVDNPDAMAGGRDLWGLPKQMAEFHWESGEMGQVTVRQEGQILCSLRSSGRLSLVRQRFSFPSFSLHDRTFLQFSSTAQANLAILRAKLDVPDTSPFGALIRSTPLLVMGADSLDLRVDTPIVIGSRVVGTV
ncbi:MAG: acetoacetate decarboxylase family protein [Leptolyngbyaceae cyanobacterium SU_3_3]|nr:acetoacetate decarboxylase family protein [Leptolyngbyaceae cyanobacterium SU_3_3]NJR49117.1 acetoacetate decarboxylase family protein [Leptolyngbyaceae cyanobacterium CSU_1_3]